MHLVYVINSFDRGGAEHGLLTLLEKGFFDGHEATIFSFCRGDDYLAERVLKAAGPRKCLIASSESRLSWRAMLKGVALLTKEIRYARPDAVVLSLKQANLVGRLVLSAFPSVRCVSFEHIARYRARQHEWVYKYLLWLLSFRVGEVWADARETLEQSRRYFMPVRRRREEIVPLFCVEADLPVKTDYAFSDPLRIVSAGRLVARKNFDKIIDAVGDLYAKGIRARLAVFGDGPERENLTRRAAKIGVAQLVEFCGYHETWFRQAASFDMFVNASDTEGFCIVVGEAMAVGLPVIATNVGGIREYGIDGTNMLKLGGPNSESLATRIMRLAADETLRRSLGQRAAADMRRDYSAEALRASGARILTRSRG